MIDLIKLFIQMLLVIGVLALFWCSVAGWVF